MGSRRRSWAIPLLFVVAAWRATSELLLRARELSASGELARRVEARQRELLELALVRAGVRERTRALVLAGDAHPGVRAYASVHVGAVRGAYDVDDVGLLEGAMRRAASERMDVSATGVQRRAERRARQAASRGEANLAADVLVDAPGSPPAAEAAPPPRRSRRPARAAAPGSAASAVRPARRDGGWTDWRFLEGDVAAFEEQVDRVPAWQLPAVAFGTMLTFAPLVRPLADAAPWLAVAGLALVGAGWLGMRRS